MKKTLIAFLALGSLAMADTTRPTSGDWDYVINQDGTRTFSITLSGGFDASLQDILAIMPGESFTLEVTQTATSWANNYGTALIGAGGDIYNNIGGNNQFRFYVGKTGSGNDGMHMNVNGWDYNSSGVENYSQADASATPSAEFPLTIGFVFTFVNAADAPDGNDYFTFSPTEGSQVTWDPKTDYNVVRSYNFANLTNVSTQAGLPADVVTTIKLTKTSPEPATATLSLLALAGLCARRKRH